MFHLMSTRQRKDPGKGKSSGTTTEKKRVKRPISSTDDVLDAAPEKKVSGRLETPAHGGGKLMRGNPNRKVNRGGRPSNRFKKWCAKMLAQSYTKKNVRRILRSQRTEPKDIKGMMELLAKYAHHELVQTRDVKVSGAKEVLDTLNEAVQDE